MANTQLITLNAILVLLTKVLVYTQIVFFFQACLLMNCQVSVMFYKSLAYEHLLIYLLNIYKLNVFPASLDKASLSILIVTMLTVCFSVMFYFYDL